MSDSHESVWSDRGRPPEQRRSPKPSRRVWLAVAAALVVLIAAVAAVVLALRDDAERNERAADAAQRRLEATERARLVREGRPVRANGPARRSGEARLAHRKRIVRAGEGAITRDARSRVRAGTLKGPVRGTECQLFPKTQTRADEEADPSLRRNRYQCFAYARRFALSRLNGKARTGLIGQPYWLIADYETGAMVFCKVTPRGGEGAKLLVEVPVAPACRDPLA